MGARSGLNRPDAIATARGWGARALLVGVLGVGLVLASVDPFTTLFFASYGTAGAILVMRRPHNAVSWILLGVAFAFIGTAARPDLDVNALVAGTASWRDFLFAWSAAWWGQAGFLGFAALSLVFPGGALPAGRQRLLAMALIAIGAACVAFSAFNPQLSVVVDGATSVTLPNRLAILPDLALWSIATPDVTILLTIVTMLVAAGWLAVRFWRATGVERLQLRWLAAAVAFCVVAVIAGLAMLSIFGDDAWFAWLPAIVAYPTVPIAIGVAVLRYRLYEIDRIVSRTVTYAIVTAILGGLFAGLVIGLQALALPIIGGSELAIVVSTVVVAGLFGPLRRRIQGLVDHRFDRGRYDAARVADEFGSRLRDGLDLDDVRSELIATAGVVLRPASASVWVRKRAQLP